MPVAVSPYAPCRGVDFVDLFRSCIPNKEWQASHQCVQQKPLVLELSSSIDDGRYLPLSAPYHSQVYMHANTHLSKCLAHCIKGSGERKIHRNAAKEGSTLFSLDTEQCSSTSEDDRSSL